MRAQECEHLSRRRITPWYAVMFDEVFTAGVVSMADAPLTVQDVVHDPLDAPMAMRGPAARRLPPSPTAATPSTSRWLKSTW